jgi:16S rRNA G527 N7-methylase RsmG
MLLNMEITAYPLANPTMYEKYHQFLLTFNEKLNLTLKSMTKKEDIYVAW